MEYDDILWTLCDVWERVKQAVNQICRTIKGTFRKFI